MASQNMTVAQTCSELSYQQVLDIDYSVVVHNEFR